MRLTHSKPLVFVTTLLKLGLPNLARVGLYRFLIAARLHPVQWIRSDACPADKFFPNVAAANTNLPVPSRWNLTSVAFCHVERELAEGVPDFLADALSGERVAAAESDWWRPDSASVSTVEVKRIWEFSRFSWALVFAQRAVAGDSASLVRLNTWLDSWISQNPAYKGPNWQCGQETSIRVLHIAVAAMILGAEQKPSDKLLWFVRTHLRRIAPTLSYAIGQDNNHATSEAAAMFVGGSLLRLAGIPEGMVWEKKGRDCLERCAKRLIANDGTFSLYSLNYHRTVLDTLSIVELWRKQMGLTSFTEAYLTKLSAAANWLRQLTDEVSGDAVNLGANDGGILLHVVDTPLRDYRPSIAISHALFRDEDTMRANEMASVACKWLGIQKPEKRAEDLKSWHAADGGFIVLRSASSMAMLRHPEFRFRPSHADGLHLDYWHNGQNILRDGGSYSYFAEEEIQMEFSGSAGHNSVKFDDEEPMPRIGRFLFGNWQKTFGVSAPQIESSVQRAMAAIKHNSGAVHHRTVELWDTAIEVTDGLSGFNKRAVLRWRLLPDVWELNGLCIKGRTARIIIESSSPAKISLTTGLESRHYLEKTIVPVIEVEINSPGIVKTLVECLE